MNAHVRRARPAETDNSYLGRRRLGGAWRPSFLQGFGRPVSVFAEYQHFWWADTTFNAPAASPAFNDTFRGQDDLLKVGFMVDLAAAGCAAAREAAGEVRHRQKLRRLGVKRTSGKLTELS